MESSHPYKEPSLTVILVLTSFLLLLNGINKFLDNLLYCGLVGQVFVGVLFGTPGANLLNDTVETAVSNLGYLGLILLVYEGGLSTSLSDLMSSFFLSSLVALSGIILPIALSFFLIPLGASPLQCFSAGASLSATSLGTAFATLSSSGLLNTEVGTILTSAAVLDDVVGLVMLQVVTELSTGQGTASDYGKTIGRALGASVGLVFVVVIIFRLVLCPLYNPVFSWLWSPKRSQLMKSTLGGVYFALVVHTALLLIIVVIGNYAGTSTLLAAFVAGTTVRWWGDVVIQSKDTDKASTDELGDPQVFPAIRRTSQTGLQVYARFYGLSTEQILKPFFFASIGFSIPITQMFHATTVWKGLVYALLMFLAKIATGLSLVPRSIEPTTQSPPTQENRTTADITDPAETTCSAPGAAPSGNSISNLISLQPNTRPQPQNEDPQIYSPYPSLNPVPEASLSTPPERRVLRVYSPALLGLAMGARGEVGFLIASVAESHGIFSSSAPSFVSTSVPEKTDELYLVVVWAIVLCTIVGPLAVGGLVRRIKRLEAQGRET